MVKKNDNNLNDLLSDKPIKESKKSPKIGKSKEVKKPKSSQKSQVKKTKTTKKEKKEITKKVKEKIVKEKEPVIEDTIIQPEVVAPLPVEFDKNVLKETRELLLSFFSINGKVFYDGIKLCVEGSVYLKKRIRISKLPIEFHTVTDTFDASTNCLISCHGVPKKCAHVNLSQNGIKYLHGLANGDYGILRLGGNNIDCLKELKHVKADGIDLSCNSIKGKLHTAVFNGIKDWLVLYNNQIEELVIEDGIILNSIEDLAKKTVINYIVKPNKEIKITNWIA